MCGIAVLLAAPSVEARTAKVPPLTPEGLPNVQSESVLVVDIDSGTQLFGKNLDEVRPIASTGKIFAAMVVRKLGIDLDAVTVITAQDAELAKGGARTRLEVGHGFRNIDLLHAMLIASDNRAPSALGRAVGLSPKALIEQMNVLARELGLHKTRFTDTCGLNGNESTAREMTLALAAAMRDPVLAEVMGTRSVEVRSVHAKPRVIAYSNTNRPLHNGSYHVLGGKTGFTNAAGYCLVIAADIGGRRVAMALLGSKGKLTRFGDFSRVRGWLEMMHGDKTVATASAAR